MADEPTGNLDSKTSDEVMALLKTSAMKYEQTLIVITHNEDVYKRQLLRKIRAYMPLCIQAAFQFH